MRYFYIYGISHGFVLYYALDKVLMQSRGLTLTQMVWLEVAYAIGVVLLEVPTGAIADRWSRKYALALNVAFAMVSTAMIAVAPGFGIFLAASLVASVHSAFESGTLTSLMYDRLLELGRPEQYERSLGKYLFYENASAVIAGILGGMIAAHYNLVRPFWLTLGAQGVSLGAALCLDEPAIHRTKSDTGYWTHIRETFVAIRARPQLQPVIMTTVVLLVCLKLTDEFMQLYFVAVGIPVFFLGYVNAAGNGIEAAGGRLGYLFRRIPRPLLYRVVCLVGGAGLLLAGYLRSTGGIVFVFAPFAAYYFVAPVLSADLHKHLDSSRRATGESFVSLARMLVLAPGGLIFSSFAERTSLFSAYEALGIVVLAWSFATLGWRRLR